MKKILLLLIASFIYGVNTEINAQGENCSSAVTITPETGSCTSPGYSNVGFGTSGDPTPSCWSTPPDNSAWFTFVATAAQVTINTNFTTTGGSITDTQVALYSGTCGALSEVNCNEDIGPGNTMAGLTQYGLTIGATYYILVDGNDGQTGDFNICIENLAIPPPAVPGKDCSTATQLCDKTPKTFDPLAAGFGSIDETGGTCLTFGEHQSIMVSFTVETSGSLEFIIWPTGASEYDWVLFNACPITNTSDIACNYNYTGSSGSPTGMGPVPGGADAGEFNASINVTAGTTYYLLISNFDDDNRGFDLTWGGTSVFAGPKASFTATPTSGCAPLTVNFTNTSTSATAYSWDFGDDSPITSVTNPTYTYTSGGTYTVVLTAQGAGACLTTFTTTITITSPAASFISSVVCNGDVTTFTNTSINSDTYQWDFTNDGTIDNTSANPTFTFPSGGTYTTRLVATNTATGCQDVIIQNVTVAAPIINITPASASYCPGSTVDLSAIITPNPSTYGVTFTNNTLTPIPDATTAKGVTTPGTLSSTINVTGVCPTVMTSSTIESVCFTIDHTKHSDIKVVTLQAGSGVAISFSPLPLSGNGVIEYCFSDADLLNFIGQNPNQIWTLYIEDNVEKVKGALNSGSLVSWNIVMNTCNTITSYNWSPTTNLANSTTLTPTATPSGTVTYTLSATDATGCTGTRDVTLTPYAVPTATISGTQTICSGSSATITVNLTGTGPWSISYTDGTNTTNASGIATSPFTFNTSSAGTYTLVSVSDANCAGTVSGSAVISINPAIVISNLQAICNGGVYNVSFNISGGNPTTYTVNGVASGSSYLSADITSGDAYSFTVTDVYGCNPQVISGSQNCACGVSASISGGGTVCTGINAPDIVFTLTGGTTSPYTLVYSINGANQSPIDVSAGFPNSTYTITNPGAGTYAIVSIQDVGCVGSGSGSVLVSFLPLPTATVSGGGTVCQGQTAPDIIITLTGTGPFNITYSNGTTSTNVTGISSSPFTISNPGAGTYTVTAVSDQNCTGTSSGSAVVTINPLPNISGTLSVCVVETTQLTGSDTPNTTNPWISSNTSVATVSNTGEVTGVSAGTSTITYTNSNGCSNTASVTVNELPVISGIAPVCVGSSITLTGSGTPNTTDPWLSSNTTVATVNSSGQVSALSAGTTAITYTNSNGCSITENVVVNALPTANFTGLAASYCLDAAPATLTPNQSGGVFSGTGVSGNSFDPALAGAGGPYTVQYDITINGCSNSSSQSVTVNPLPIISGTLSVCVGSITDLDATNTPGTNPWAVVDVTGSATIDPTTGELTGVSAGDVSVTYTDDNGCTATETITINPTPDAQFTALNVSYCLGALPITITANQMGGTFSGTGVTDNGDGTATFSVGVTGNYTITYDIIDANGCTNSSSQNIDVTDLDDASFTLADFCEGSPSSANITGVTGGTFDVSPNTNGETIDANGIISNAVVGTTYTVTYYTPNGVCQNNSQVTVTVLALPTATITGGATICAGDALPELSISFTGTGDWTFILNGSSVTTGSNPYVFTPTTGGTYTVTTVTDAVCTNSANSSSTTITVTVPVADFEANPEEGTAPLDVQFTNLSNGNTFSWDFGDGNTSTQENPLNTYTTIGEYIVTLTITVNGCTATATDTITVIGGSIVDIPNVFSPNNDTKNDWFKPITENMSVERLQIFNRWGQLLFEGDEVGVYWDGTYNGQPAPEGTYYYIYYGEGQDGKIYDSLGEGEDKCDKCKGHLTLVRKM